MPLDKVAVQVGDGDPTEYSAGELKGPDGVGVVILTEAELATDFVTKSAHDAVGKGSRKKIADARAEGAAGRFTPEELLTEDHAEHLQGLIDLGDRKSTRLNSSHTDISRMPSSA